MARVKDLLPSRRDVLRYGGLDSDVSDCNITSEADLATETESITYNTDQKTVTCEPKSKRLKKLFSPLQDPYYSSDPLARAFCEWNVLMRKKKYLEEFCPLWKK